MRFMTTARVYTSYQLEAPSCLIYTSTTTVNHENHAYFSGSIDAFVVAENGIEQRHSPEIRRPLFGSTVAYNSVCVGSDRLFFDEALNLQLMPPSVLNAIAVETRGTKGHRLHSRPARCPETLRRFLYAGLL